MSVFFLKNVAVQIILNLKFDSNANWSRLRCDPHAQRIQRWLRSVCGSKQGGHRCERIPFHYLSDCAVEEGKWKVYCNYASLWSSSCYFRAEQRVDRSLRQEWRDRDVNGLSETDLMFLFVILHKCIEYRFNGDVKVMIRVCMPVQNDVFLS